jgi:hypothetical protein
MANDPFQFNQPADLEAMKDSVADRKFNIKLEKGLITAAGFAGGIGALVLTPVLGPLAPALGAASVAGAATLADFVTTKQTEKLKIDQEFVESRMQGKNYWGGYREEVADNHIVSPALMNLPNNKKAAQPQLG